MKYYSLFFSLKVWLSSALITPAVFIPLQLFTTAGKQDLAEFAVYPFLVIFEIAFSFFTWIMFWALIELLVRLTNDRILRKIMISLMGVVLTFGTFKVFSLLDGSDSYMNFFELMVTNAIVIALGSWYFNIEPKNNPETLTDPLSSIRPHEN